MSKQVKSILSRCMECKVLKARPGAQVISDLPECRFNVARVMAGSLKSHLHIKKRKRECSLEKEARGGKVRKIESQIASVEEWANLFK